MINKKWYDDLCELHDKLMSDNKSEESKYKLLIEYPNVKDMFEKLLPEMKKSYPDKSDFELLLRIVGKYLDSVFFE